MVPLHFGSKEPKTESWGTEKGTDPRTVPLANSVLPRLAVGWVRSKPLHRSVV